MPLGAVSTSTTIAEQVHESDFDDFGPHRGHGQ